MLFLVKWKIVVFIRKKTDLFSNEMTKHTV